jgi:hypothetical protein
LQEGKFVAAEGWEGELHGVVCQHPAITLHTLLSQPSATLIYRCSSTGTQPGTTGATDRP